MVGRPCHPATAGGRCRLRGRPARPQRPDLDALRRCKDFIDFLWDLADTH